MAIAVDGYGNITSGNAKEIYTAWKRGEVDLNKAQQSKCESYLTPEELDEVEYDDKVTANRGKNAINTENTKDGGNAVEGTSTGASAMAAGGTIAAIILSMQAAKTTSNTNGFVGVAVALAVGIVGSILSLGLALGFDSELKDRNQHSKTSEADNAELDKYSDTLANTMDMMNEDVEHYNETQDKLTTSVNTQASMGADLQMQIDAAMAAGDTNKAQQLKEQLKALKDTDNSGLEEDLAETSECLDNYKALNVEAGGCAESGQTVSNFLKAGQDKGVLAMINGGLCAVGAIAAGLAAAFVAIPKLWTPFGPIDAPASAVGTIIWSSVAAVMGSASGIFFAKGSQELECASNGNTMQEHVDNLNDLKEQQTAYTEDTEGQYADSDAAAAESKDAAAETAGEAVTANKDNLGKKPKEKEPVGGGIM